MRSAYTKLQAEGQVYSYIREVKKQMRSIEKDLKDMDLKNAKVRNDFAEIVIRMINNCNKLITDIEFYDFE